MRLISRQLLTIALATLVIAVAFLGFAGPAAAHDAAESSSPAQGASVPVPPGQVSVTFNNPPLGIGSSFSVRDSTGAEWADGPVEIVDNVATQNIKPGGPGGQYTVAWRVVSSDSHPIEGSFAFMVVSAAGEATPGGNPTTVATVPAVGTAEPGVTAAPSETVDSAQPFQWSIVIFAAVALALLATLGILARRKLTSTSDEGH